MNDPRFSGDLSDSIVAAVDNGLKTLSGSFQSSRENPCDGVEAEEMSDSEKEVLHLASYLLATNGV